MRNYPTTAELFLASTDGIDPVLNGGATFDVTSWSRRRPAGSLLLGGETLEPVGVANDEPPPFGPKNTVDRPLRQRTADGVNGCARQFREFLAVTSAE